MTSILTIFAAPGLASRNGRHGEAENHQNRVGRFNKKKFSFLN